MRVTIKAHEMPKSKVNPDYVVKEVRYVVSEDSRFQTPHLRDVVKTTADDKMMEYSFEYDFPNEEVLYGFTEITYVNNEVEKSTVCRLNYKQPGFSYNNNIIVTPVVKLKYNMDGDIVPVNGIELELSEFEMFMGHGSLDSTTWRIFDSEERIVLEKIRDEFNKTSLTIPDNLLEENRLYRVEAIYFNNYDSESYPGVLIINTAGNFSSFSVDNSSVSFVNNGISTFNTNCNFVNFQNLRIDIFNTENEIVLESFISTSTLVTIPKIGLLAGERYYVRVSAVFLNNRGEFVSSKPIEFSTICKDIGKGKEYDPSYSYTNRMSAIIYDLNNIFINKISGYTQQLPNGDIPIFNIFNNSIDIRYFKFSNNSLVDTNRGAKIISVNTIDINTPVNIKLLKDLITGVTRLIVAFNISENRVEVKSYVYTNGEFGNIDNSISPNSVILENAKVLENSDSILEFKDDEFLLGIISTLDNKNMIALKIDLSSYAYVPNLYQASSVVNNSISMFRLPDNKILKISSDMPIQRYGVYDIEDNHFVDKGIILPEMQNAFDNDNGNRWYGFDRQDGNTLLIPRFATLNRFNVFLYNYYTDTMEKIISKSDMIIPGKYQAGEVTTVEKIYTIELRDGTLLLMFSGNKAGIDYKDIWRYI